MQTKVSIIITAHNYAGYLRKAIDSGLSQDYPDGFEVVVVNDASTDETDQICRSYGNRIVYLKNEHNIGQGASQNRAIKAANGEYICTLDADDALLPGAIKWYAKTLDDFPFAGVVYGDIISINEIKGTKNRHRSPDFDRKLLELRNIVYCSSQMFRKDVLEKIGGYDVNLYHVEDYDVILRATERMCGMHVPRLIEERTIKYDSMTGHVSREGTWQKWKSRALMKMKKRKLINCIKNILFPSEIKKYESQLQEAKLQQALNQCDFIIAETSPKRTLIAEDELRRLTDAFRQRGIDTININKIETLESSGLKGDFDLFVLWNVLERFTEDQAKKIISQIIRLNPKQIALLVETREFYDGAWDMPTRPYDWWVGEFGKDYCVFQPKQKRPDISEGNWFYNYGLDKVIFLKRKGI